MAGEVLNDADGVLIRAFGEAAALDLLTRRLERESPPLARIDAISRTACDWPGVAPADFSIVESVAGKANTSVAADAATCPACAADIEDPANRRYRYPFTNCTHCGPRLSIVESIPYDRARTSMKAFPMCPSCEAEYRDPADRRFHAQPNACPDCGPRAWLEDRSGQPVPTGDGQDAVGVAAERLAAGQILAIKGIGGFHLACDATNAEAVATLRARKHRYAKALAMMARDTDVIRQHARLGAGEEALLKSPAAPIVVLDARGVPLPDAIAPGQDTLGFMLPYTPLHHLLLADVDFPIVLTSGNLSDEPQVIDNEVARSRLACIVDAFLMHDRDIVNRLDDSVVAVVNGETTVLRRARGFAPEPVPMPAGFDAADGVLAMGGELKNTFCIVSHGKAVVSQHIGDMEEASALLDAERNLELYQRLFEFEPSLVAVDAHPEYLPSKRARIRFAAQRIVDVQHHHAHIAACLVEHGVPADTPPVLGVVLDGLGYGEDGSLWGGEFLLADYARSDRVGHFTPVALPGGARAMREPWRNTWAHLDAALGWDAVADQYGDLEAIAWLATRPVDTLATMCSRGLNSPLASSAGRLFDAVAGFLGLCRDGMSHEAEAAMALEAAAARSGESERAYEATLDTSDGGAVLSWAPLWQGVLDDTRRGIGIERIAARFHAGLATTVATLARRLAEKESAKAIVLTGGVFQNRLLLEGVLRRLESADVPVLAPTRFPANDGGISLGQAAIAARRQQLGS